MKLVSIDEVAERGRKITSFDRFSFRCHPDVSCFNRCCRNLNLFLYPFDAIRLRKSLGITSGEFIDNHVDVVMREGCFFPDVLLRMSEDSEASCPYLTPEGCSVYSDRPDACRAFPVEHGVYINAKGIAEDVHFFRPPEFCMGQHEEKQWTVKTWAEDQNAVEYNRMTKLWGETKALFGTDPWGGAGHTGSKAKMAFMAAYNIDGFRGFIFESSFLQRYKLKTDLLKKLKSDDVTLMKFGFEWIRFFVWGMKSDKIRLR